MDFCHFGAGSCHLQVHFCLLQQVSPLFCRFSPSLGRCLSFLGGVFCHLATDFHPFRANFPPLCSIPTPPPHVQPRPIAVRVYILHPPLCHIQPSSAGWGQDLGLGLGFGVRVGVFRLGSGVMVGFWGHDLRLGSGLGLDLRPGLGFGVLN